jgi:hypothetical protein
MRIFEPISVPLNNIEATHLNISIKPCRIDRDGRINLKGKK